MTRVFEELGINVDPHRIMSTMPVSQRQMVEIAKAVSYNSKVIVFDEPTSSLTEEEVEHLFQIINMLRDRGVGIIYISHKMAEIKRISDYITIMRDGQWIATEKADDLEMADIIRLMVGRELTNQFPPKTNVPGDVYLEVEHLFKIINMLRDRGVGIIYISHKMAEIKRISDYITIMRDGQWIATERAADLEMADIIRLMVGRELTNQFPPKTNVPGDVYLEVQHVTGMYNQLRDVSFVARRGEIVGLAGLDSSGRTETLESIFGIRTRKDGIISLDDQPCFNRNAGESIKNGFALLTEERRATGIFGCLNIRENTVISSLKRHLRFGIYLSEKTQREDTQYYIDAMHTKTPTQETKIRSLSGGNQQKVIIGRWLLTEPEVLLLDEPTRGIDVGAKYEIYQLIIDLANKGKTVIMVSSEMPELLGVCDRIVVMSGGRVAGEVDAKNTTQEAIMTLAAKYV